MDTFGNLQPKVIPLELSENQFQIYNKISRNYSHSFLFESLAGPEILAVTSVMGFDPKTILKGYSDKVEIITDGKTQTIQTNDPFKELKKILEKSKDQSYRYLGGAVGVVNYDAIRLVEDIPDTHDSPQPSAMFDEQKQHLANAIAALPYKQREVVLLRHFRDFKFKKIASLQNVSVNTVQGRYRYGLDKLRSLLNGEIK